MSVKPLWYRWARVYFYGGCIIGSGVLAYNYIRPTDEELIARFSPEVRADYEKNKELRQLEQQRLMEIVKKTSQSNEPIWKTGPLANPFEKDVKNTYKLVDEQKFFKEQSDSELKSTLSSAQKELEETEKLSKKKPFWKLW